MKPELKEKLNTEWETITLPQKGLTPEGIALARRFLGNKYRFVPEDWNWQWLIKGRGEYVGTLPKRVAKFLHKSGQNKMTPQELGEFGSIVSENTIDSEDFTLRFTQDFNWEPGDYGDDGSCFWSCRSGARGMLFEHDSWAVQFGREKENNYGEKFTEGYARAFLITETSFSLAVINGYGIGALKIGQILAHHLGLYYKKGTMKNMDSACGTLWINGSCAIFLSEQEDIIADEDKICVDLEWADETIICRRCGEPIGDGHDTDAGYYCGDCFYEVHTFCQHCEEYCLSEDMAERPYRRDNDAGSVCVSCVESDAAELCKTCNTYFCDNALEDVPGGYACRVCLKDHYTACDECGDFEPTGTLTVQDDMEYCQSCFDGIFVACYRCYRNIDREDAIDFNNGLYCSVCHEGPEFSTQKVTAHLDASLCKVEMIENAVRLTRENFIESGVSN